MELAGLGYRSDEVMFEEACSHELVLAVDVRFGRVSKLVHDVAIVVKQRSGDEHVGVALLLRKIRGLQCVLGLCDDFAAVV